MRITDGDRTLFLTDADLEEFKRKITQTNPIISVMYRMLFLANPEEVTIGKAGLTDLITRVRAAGVSFELESGIPGDVAPSFEVTFGAEGMDPTADLLKTGNPVYLVAFGCRASHRDQDDVYFPSMTLYSPKSGHDFNLNDAPELLAAMAERDARVRMIAQPDVWASAEPVKRPDLYAIDATCPLSLGTMFREVREDVEVKAWFKHYEEPCPCGFPWNNELAIFAREVSLEAARTIMHTPDGIRLVIHDAGEGTS